MGDKEREIDCFEVVALDADERGLVRLLEEPGVKKGSVVLSATFQMIGEDGPLTPELITSLYSGLPQDYKRVEAQVRTLISKYLERENYQVISEE